MTSTHRNVALLAACQAMLFTNNSTLIAINGLAGLALAPAAAFATLPVTFWVIGGAVATLPASFYMKRVGRKTGFLSGAAIGIVGALICALAIWMQSFWLLCFGTLVWGGYNAFGQYYRFAAADSVPQDFKATAISLVLAGGLVGGILGPTTSRLTIDAMSPKFMGAYLALIGFVLVTMALLSRIRIPDPTHAERTAVGRSLSEIARQPKFAVAVLSGAIGYGVMNFLMTSTPIAMGDCGLPYGDAAFVISSHVVAMFAPSFFTGPLIKRAGVLPVMFIGAVLNFVAVGIALAGLSVANFWWSLVLLGVGWNFLFVGGTTLLTESYRPEERAKAQGVNDFVVFAMMTLSSLTSGIVVTNSGWAAVNLFALPMLVVAAAAIVWLGLKGRAAQAAA